MIDNDAEYAAILEELDRMVPESDATLRRRADYRRTGHLAHGWYARTRRISEAILLLGQLDYAGEAGPLRRSLIEHNAALAWMAAGGDNVVDSVKHAHCAWLKSQQESLIDAGRTSVDMAEFDETLASTAGGDSSRAVNRISELFEEVPRRDRLEVLNNRMRLVVIREPVETRAPFTRRARAPARPRRPVNETRRHCAS